MKIDIIALHLARSEVVEKKELRSKIKVLAKEINFILTSEEVASIVAKIVSLRQTNNTKV